VWWRPSFDEENRKFISAKHYTETSTVLRLIPSLTRFGFHPASFTNEEGRSRKRAENNNQNDDELLNFYDDDSLLIVIVER
jgi:hypothetical protein